MQNYLATKKILTYDDVVKFSAGSGNEPLVDVRLYDNSIVSEYLKEDMLEITGDIIYVRDTLAKKLALVNQELGRTDLKLKVVYGYRHPDIQKRYFQKRCSELKEEYPELKTEEIYRIAHNFVAVPEVAGHPAGAAIDVTVLDKDNNQLDMGTNIADYKDPLLIQTFDKRLTKEHLRNRMLLHNALVEQGFAPFYGEWWHFSYGDREWAAFYNKKALYGAIKFEG